MLLIAVGAALGVPYHAFAASAPPSDSTATADTGPVQASALMLATHWSHTLDPSLYLVSEKLDGVRAYWDGRQLRFKSGRPLAAPSWFTAALPAQALDGELWMGRRSFERLSGTVRRAEPQDAAWREVRYMVFDLPGSVATFTERAAELKAVVTSAGVPWLAVVDQQRGSDLATLQLQLTQTVQAGGEGLVLHRADARWQSGRSEAVRKLKAVQDDEARVVAHVSGKGKYQGKMGGLLLETAAGQRFVLGTGFSDAQRSSPPAVGAWVSYQYRDLTSKGLPRFASYLRIREAE
ncbi:DNA ligase [Rhodoferax aquaticus]|uniref:DNA ligase n=2 Tax=Rhodoferax aquaticus TaxID=2527691 RepID=A0A515EVZ2_9BURK|nr:DNA ligase [Rhodoferax aquaticus]